ncbi:uncharacterized protein G2W53_019596 [Senna tora]|uniref:Uncharacterized protein n=1 Tax=Senna tora TaxID=362788 RepID=A0A834TW61_9FABA|nr:uncharacterized protein G2W53_019596 [Senna tora]
MERKKPAHEKLLRFDQVSPTLRPKFGLNIYIYTRGNSEEAVRQNR